MQSFDESAEDNDLNRIVHDAISQIMREQDCSLPDLAKRLGMEPDTLYRRLRYRSYNLGFLQELAEALGVPVRRLFEQVADSGGRVWDPVSEEPTVFYDVTNPHAETSTGAVMWFRVPNGPIVPQVEMAALHRNLFGGFWEDGEKLARAFELISNDSREEYEQTGGEYGGFRMLQLIFATDLERLLTRGYPYIGFAPQFPVEFLENLRVRHVKKMHYDLRVVRDDESVPSWAMRKLAPFESIILIGETLSVRRRKGDFSIEFINGGHELQADTYLIRVLERRAIPLNEKRLETLLRKLERGTFGSPQAQRSDAKRERSTGLLSDNWWD